MAKNWPGYKGLIVRNSALNRNIHTTEEIDKEIIKNTEVINKASDEYISDIETDNKNIP